VTRSDRPQTTEPLRAADIAFRKLIRRTSTLSMEASKSPFAEVSDAWGTNRFLSGSVDAIYAIVLYNLENLAQQPEFLRFRIQWRTAVALQITAFSSPNVRIPIQIWRTGEQFFANGDANFKPPPHPDDEVSGTWGEGSKCRHCDSGILQTTVLEGFKRAAVRLLPTALSPLSIAANFFSTVLDPDHKLPITAHLKCNVCKWYAIRCPFCHHLRMLRDRLETPKVLRCERCDSRFRLPHDG
jgi:hypothetical protein